jgi:hypothetical protein
LIIIPETICTTLHRVWHGDKHKGNSGGSYYSHYGEHRDRRHWDRSFRPPGTGVPLSLREGMLI